MKSIAQLQHEYENTLYLAEGLTQTHQQTMRNDLLNHAESLKEDIFEQEKTIREEYRKTMKGFK